jgi:DNA invertase Pin-like site-specific DNA recombinase
VQLNNASHDNQPPQSQSDQDQTLASVSMDGGLTKSNRQQRKVEKTACDAKEIASLIVAAHKRLPRHLAKSVGMIYARYSSDLQHSIVDQVRELLEFAVLNEIFIPLEFIFWDSGISGRKKNRPGLNAMREALEKDRAQVLLVFHSSRLFRRGYYCMKFVVEDVVSEGKRAIFLKNNIDTEKDGHFWQGMLGMMSLIDEMIAKLTVPNIHAAHVGMLLNCIVHGTVTYGYTGENIPGQLRRNGLPRRRYEIDAAEAKWVRQIFDWYVTDRLSIREIVRRLNANLNCPRPRNSPTNRWSRGPVIRLLSNARYRGDWAYGRTQNVWDAKRDCGKTVMREKPLGTKQFDQLRIVTDDQWYAAQQLLMALRQKYARDRKRNKRSKDKNWMLYRLFFCAVHQRPLYSQCGGKYLFCPTCKDSQSDQSLFSLLPKELAIRLTLRQIRQLVCVDSELVKRVIAACQDASVRFQRPEEGQLSCLRKDYDKLTSRIKLIFENPGETDTDQEEARNELKTLRIRRAQVEAQLQAAEHHLAQEVRVPTEEAIRSLLSQFEQITCTTVELDEERQELLLSLIQSITGGRIHLHQMGERKKHQGWIQGRFVSQLTNTVLQQISPILTENEPGHEITIDFREVVSSVIEQRADRVKELYDEGKQMKEIAKFMGINVNMAIKSLKLWFKRAGLPYPNNAVRRGALRRADPHGSVCNRITPEVIRLVEAGYSNQDIAKKLGCSKDLITKVLKRFDEKHGTTYCDLKTRNRLIKRPPDSDQAA